MDLNMIVAFGGIGLLGLVGFLYVWFSTSKRPPKETDASKSAHPSNRR